MRDGEFPDGARACCAPRSTWRTPNMLVPRPDACTASSMPTITARATSGASTRCTTMPTARATRSSSITHSICTLEFDVHRPLYDWFIQALEHLPFAPVRVRPAEPHLHDDVEAQAAQTRAGRRRRWAGTTPACRRSAPCAARATPRPRCGTSPRWWASPSATT